MCLDRERGKFPGERNSHLKIPGTGGYKRRPWSWVIISSKHNTRMCLLLSVWRAVHLPSMFKSDFQSASWKPGYLVSPRRRWVALEEYLAHLDQMGKTCRITLKRPHQAWQTLCSWSGNTSCPQTNPSHQHPVSWVSSGTHASVLYQVSVESYGLVLCCKRQCDVVERFGVSRFESDSIFAIYRWDEWAS